MQIFFKNGSIATEVLTINQENVGKSVLHNYCPNKYNNSVLASIRYSLNQAYVKEGDVIELSEFFRSNNTKLNYVEVYVGIRKDRLTKINLGNTKFDLIYYKGGDILVYKLICINFQKFNKITDSSFFTTNLKRPSFVYSNIGTILVFITLFVLLSQFLQIFYNPFK